MKEIYASKDLFKEINLQSYSNTHEINICNYKIRDDIQFATTGEFLNKFNIQESKFDGFFSFEGNHFKHTLIIENCLFNDFTISACSFLDQVIFSNCIFKGKFTLIDSTFHSITKLHKNSFLGGCNLFEKFEPYGAVEFKGGLEFF